jgi:hypothetical protein
VSPFMALQMRQAQALEAQWKHKKGLHTPTVSGGGTGIMTHQI